MRTATAAPEPAPEQPAPSPTGARQAEVGFAEPAVVALPDAPTERDYEVEHGQFIATGNCLVGRSVARRKGMPVPASHPLLGQWLEQGVVERVATPKD